MKGINKGIYLSKGIIMFKTDHNTMLDWILSGRDNARYNVAIAKLGIVTHPFCGAEKKALTCITQF
jgi:hypothetical protein